MTNNLADVAVIIPCFNCEKTIQRAFNSILCQSLIPQQVIFIDDFSTDETLDVLYQLKAEALRKEPNLVVTIIALPENGGPSKARNIGWEKATNRYIAFLDADDAWKNDKIKVQLSYMQAHPSCLLSGHKCDLKSEDEFLNVDYDTSAIKPFRKISLTPLLVKNIYPTPTVMVRTDVAYRFNEEMRYCEDYLLWLEVGNNSGYIAYTPEKLSVIFKSPYGVSGLSSNLSFMFKGEMLAYKTFFEKNKTASFVRFLTFALSRVRYFKRLFTMMLRNAKV